VDGTDNVGAPMPTVWGNRRQASLPKVISQVGRVSPRAQLLGGQEMVGSPSEIMNQR